MDADPWRNPFDEPQPAASTSASHGWSARNDEDGLQDVEVTAPGHLTHSTSNVSWDPAGDENNAWSWQGSASTNLAAPPSPPKWKDRSWSPPPVLEPQSSAVAHDDELAANAEFTSASPSPPPEHRPSPSFALNDTHLGSPWGGDEYETSPIPAAVADYEARSLSPSPRSPTAFEPSSPVPASPDGFGTFAVASTSPQARHSEDMQPSWSTPGVAASTFEAEVSWGSAISAHTHDTEVDRSPRRDEWQAAASEQEQIDRILPPSLLGIYVREFEQVLDEIWKPPETDAPDNWRASSGILEEYASMRDTMTPPLTLRRTLNSDAIRAASASALKLSRHSAVAHYSPFSILQASRGSTSWEDSVKKFIQPTAEEGWGILSTAAAKVAAPSSQSTGDAKKAPGGLLSFFTRRESSQPASATAVAVPPSPTMSSPPAPSTPRISTSSAVSTTEPPASVKQSLEAPSLSTSRASSMEFPKPTPTPTPNVTLGPIEAVRPTSVVFPTDEQDTHDAEHDGPAPSAVSRFLGRFARTKSDAGFSTTHRPMAMSETDFSYLDETVPTVSGHAASHGLDSDDFSLDGGLLGPSSSVLSNGRYPGSSTNAAPLLPPPLAPPPRPVRTSTIGPTPPSLPSAASLASPSTASFGSSPGIVAAANAEDDLWDLFGSAPQPPNHPPSSSFTSPPPSSSSKALPSTSSFTPSPPNQGLPRPHLPISSSRSATSTPAPAAPRRAVPARMATDSTLTPSPISSIPVLAPPPLKPSTSTFPPPQLHRPSNLSIDSTSIGSVIMSPQTSSRSSAQLAAGLGGEVDEDDVVLAVLSRSQRRHPTEVDSALATPASVITPYSAASGSSLLGPSDNTNASLPSAMFDDFGDFGDFAEVDSSSSPATPFAIGHAKKGSVPLPSEIMAASTSALRYDDAERELPASPFAHSPSPASTPPARAPAGIMPKVTTLASPFGRNRTASSASNSSAKYKASSPIASPPPNISRQPARSMTGTPVNASGTGGGLNFDFLRSSSLGPSSTQAQSQTPSRVSSPPVLLPPPGSNLGAAFQRPPATPPPLFPAPTTGTGMMTPILAPQLTGGSANGDSTRSRASSFVTPLAATPVGGGSKPAGKSGLSAQDLSFFEGL